MIDLIEYYDTVLFQLINGFHNPFFDWLMTFISGTLSWIPLYAVLLFFAIKKEKKYWWLLIIAISLLIIIADQTSVRLFKELFKRYRPCHNLELKMIVHLVNGKCGGLYGFVSSHASNVFALAIFLSWYFSKKWLSISLLFWASIIAYSRIYLGVHYPADVVGGAILGITIGTLLFYAYNYTLKRLAK
ncbi:MAG: phosphatase PAP2 family protein [Salinivirgaceae bacterium]|nr:phosphatase PAP2 family protein [Salinivirgaceae bacterium]